MFNVKIYIMHQFFIGTSLAWIYLYYILNNKSGTLPKYIRPSIHGILENGHIIIKGLHIHHWIIFSVILLIILILNLVCGSQYLFLFGITLTFIYHGLGYDDCFNINIYK